MAGKNKAQYQSEINVTPFVDVVLVLLIIFMITAPMLDQGVEIDLPQTKEVEVLPNDVEHLVLTIQKNGKLFLDSYEVQLNELEERVNILVTEKSRALFIKADSNVPYGVVVDIMGRIKSAGIENLGIVANPSDITADDLKADAQSDEAENNDKVQ
jgi:Biopolymer transport protein